MVNLIPRIFTHLSVMQNLASPMIGLCNAEENLEQHIDVACPRVYLIPTTSMHLYMPSHDCWWWLLWWRRRRWWWRLLWWSRELATLKVCTSRAPASECHSSPRLVKDTARCQLPVSCKFFLCLCHFGHSPACGERVRERGFAPLPLFNFNA